MTSEILKHAEDYVRTLLSEKIPSTRVFHNLNHTLQVVQRSQFLVSRYVVPEPDRLALITAAWFHDTGYCKTNSNHEKESVRIADDFLRSMGVGKKDRSRIEKLIMATQLPSTPVALNEKILCDADMAHLGSVDYENWSLRLKEELEYVSGYKMSDAEWTQQNISFFKSHRYFTETARQFWEKQKQKNLFLLVDQGVCI